MKRHFFEIIGSCFIGATFGLFSSAFNASWLGVPALLSRAVVARSVTVALALPISTALGTDALAVTATSVMLTGLLGAAFAQVVLDKLKFKDPIVRGMAVAASAHGLGTAALAAKEPEALPYCALAYAVVGIISTLLVQVPWVRLALLSITG